MAAPSIIITGVKELMEKLDQFEPKLRKKILRKTLRKAAKPVLATARRYVPVDTAALKKSLKVRALKRSRRHKHRVGIAVMTSEGWFKGDEYYGAFVEFGHRVGKRTRKVERLRRSRFAIARALAGLADSRPRVEPKKYMHPAYELNKVTVMQVFREELRHEIEAVAKT